MIPHIRGWLAVKKCKNCELQSSGRQLAVGGLQQRFLCALRVSVVRYLPAPSAGCELTYLGHSHPNVPAVSSAYTSPSKTCFAVVLQSWPFQMESLRCAAP